MFNLNNYEVDVYIDGYNFKSYLISISSNPIEKSFFGDTITIPNASLVLDNTSDIFSYMKANSFFYGRDFTESSVRIGYNLTKAGEIILFDGIISKITLDWYKATLAIDASLQRIMTKTALYIGEDDSPAYHAKELLKLYGAMIDEISFETVINNQEADGIRCSVTALPIHNMSIINILQTLSDIGLMTIYYENGFVRCQYFKNNIASNSINDNEIFNTPKIESIEYLPYDGYAIETVSGTISENAQNGKNIKALTADSSSVVKINNAVTAFNIGEFYLSSSLIHRDRIFVDVSKEIASILDLSSVISLFNKDYSITKIDRNKSSLFVSIEGVSL